MKNFTNIISATFILEVNCQEVSKSEGVELKRPETSVLCCFVFMFRPTAAFLEMLRCVVMVTMLRFGYMKPLLPSLAVPTEVRPHGITDPTSVNLCVILHSSTGLFSLQFLYSRV